MVGGSLLASDDLIVCGMTKQTINTTGPNFMELLSRKIILTGQKLCSLEQHVPEWNIKIQKQTKTKTDKLKTMTITSQEQDTIITGET